MEKIKNCKVIVDHLLASTVTITDKESAVNLIREAEMLTEPVTVKSEMGYDITEQIQLLSDTMQAEEQLERVMSHLEIDQFKGKTEIYFNNLKRLRLMHTIILNSEMLTKKTTENMWEELNILLAYIDGCTQALISNLLGFNPDELERDREKELEGDYDAYLESLVEEQFEQQVKAEKKNYCQQYSECGDCPLVGLC